MFLTLVPHLSSLGGFGVPPLHLSLSSRCFCLMYGAWFKETRGDSACDDTTQGREWKWVGGVFSNFKRSMEVCSACVFFFSNTFPTFMLLQTSTLSPRHHWTAWRAKIWGDVFKWAFNEEWGRVKTSGTWGDLSVRTAAGADASIH